PEPPTQALIEQLRRAASDDAPAEPVAHAGSAVAAASQADGPARAGARWIGRRVIAAGLAASVAVIAGIVGLAHKRAGIVSPIEARGATVAGPSPAAADLEAAPEPPPWPASPSPRVAAAVATAGVTALAVLPFSASGEERAQSTADIITDDLINN